MSEPLTRLAALPPAKLDAARAERIRVHCRTRLARQTPRVSDRPGVRPRGGRAPIWQPVVLVLAVGYMTEAIIQALRVYGLL